MISLTLLVLREPLFLFTSLTLMRRLGSPSSGEFARPTSIRARIRHALHAVELALASSGMTRPFPCAIFLAYSNWAGLTGLGSCFPAVSPSVFLGACSLRNLRQIVIDVL